MLKIRGTGADLLTLEILMLRLMWINEGILVLVEIPP